MAAPEGVFGESLKFFVNSLTGKRPHPRETTAANIGGTIQGPPVSASETKICFRPSSGFDIIRHSAPVSFSVADPPNQSEWSVDIAIKLLVRRGEGALASAADELSSSGFRFYDHSLKVINEASAELEILASGDGDAEALRPALSALEAVQEVLEIGRLQVPVEEDSEAQVEQENIDPWVERVVHDWPDVMGLLKEISAPLSEAERVHRLTSLGISVGRALYRQRAPSSPPTSITGGLERVVLPAIEPVAMGKVHGQTLRIRETIFACGEMVDLLFTPVEEEGGYCCLLSGIVAGMLNEIPSIAPVRVTETRCLAQGHQVCDFVAEKIPR